MVVSRFVGSFPCKGTSIDNHIIDDMEIALSSLFLITIDIADQIVT